LTSNNNGVIRLEGIVAYGVTTCKDRDKPCKNQIILEKIEKIDYIFTESEDFSGVFKKELLFF